MIFTQKIYKIIINNFYKILLILQNYTRLYARNINSSLKMFRTINAIFTYIYTIMFWFFIF